MAASVALAPQAASSLPSAQSTPSKKRSHDGELIDHASCASTAQLESSPLTPFQSSTSPRDSSDQPSPLTELGTTPTTSPVKVPDMAPAPGKKPKQSFTEKQAEKAIKQAEKEEKERLKAEAKAKKDEEKAKKDEERKRKEEEKEALRKVKEEKKREKDAEKQAREAERQRKEAESLRKERAQMRLGAFFGKPTATSLPAAVSDCEDISRATTPSRRSSIASIDLDPPLVDTKLSPTKHLKSDARPFIMPFFIKEHMQLAPFNRFLSNRSPLPDELPLHQHGVPEKIDVRFHKRRRTRHVRPVKKILSEMNGSENAPLDLTNPASSLGNIPYKYLFYREDIRPAYQGTYTRPVSPRTARKLALKPSYRGLPDTNYDYDSEAEWQEPEEGDEEILDDDEKSEDGDGDEEMEDFLDDEGDVAKRQMVVGSMEPKCSGLCWEDGTDHRESGFDLSHYRIDVLHDSTRLPIDPYSTVHWSDAGKKSPVKREEKSQQCAAMQPPRLPLMAVDPNSGNTVSLSPFQNHVSNAAQSENNILALKAKANASGKSVKLVPPELMPAFRAAVAGSTLTKVGLLEVLKTQFPKCTKDAIKHTVEGIAERRSAPVGEKRWVLLDN
ncbi:putative chromatin assembly factor 1 subunit A [Cladophialophora carrionii]|uniref:Putative chromatin assembly factor 1 subunit A n=1 Tax=Cladophialophora carrionii TaxID=86049 RepID=A0A1C1CW47_9EURO|nr:putative chromatin assembly factor 1 subunit A [Cladophialophora carrionii]